MIFLEFYSIPPTYPPIHPQNLLKRVSLKTSFKKGSMVVDNNYRIVVRIINRVNKF